MDGVFLMERLMRKNRYENKLNSLVCGPAIRSEEGVKTRPMRFAKITFGNCLSLCGASRRWAIVTGLIGTEDLTKNSIEEQKGIIDQVGEITIEVYRKSVLGPASPSRTVADLTPIPRIHEKLSAKDSKTHSIM